MLRQVFQTEQALGGSVSIVVTTDNPEKAQILFRQLWKQVFTFERQFSRFLPSSELSIFNRNAGTKQFITPEFRQLLSAAKDMAQFSGQMYNPFILPALQRAGYKASALPGYEKDPVDDHSNKAVVSAEKLEVGDDWARIPYGTAIDMGGCGKGYLADQLADLLDRTELAGYWVSLGGDMVVSGHDEHGKPWVVDVQSASDLCAKLPEYIQTDGRRTAIATSGTFKRSNQPALKGKHHIIDPLTNRPAETDISLVTVLDGSALHADVLASCAVITGSGKVVKYLQNRGVSGGIIQFSASSGDIKTKTFGQYIHAVKEQTAEAKNA